MPLTLLVLGLVSGLAYLPFAAMPPGALRSVLKTLPLILIAASGWAASASPYLITALLLSAGGDLALSRSGRAAFLYGLACFGLAHGLFVLVFTQTSGLPLWHAFATAPLLASALVLLAMSTELWLVPHTGGLAWPVRSYVAVITAMGLAALELPATMTAATFGAALFIASDLLLAIRLFRMSEENPAAHAVSRLLWGLYLSGQALIVIGLALR